MIQITEQAARAVLRLLDDVTDIDCRARCSDAYFRQHFMTVARLPAVVDAAKEIREAMEPRDPTEEHPPDVGNNPDG